jgi:lysophospholipase L1-like esterase
VLHEQASRVSDNHPTLVTLGVGTNDLIRGVNIEQFASNYEKIVKRLKEGEGTSVILMNIPDISSMPIVPSYMRDAAKRHVVIFNQRIEGIAKRQNLTVIDLYGSSRDFTSHPEFFSEDGFHPSDAGYEFWAELMWPDVEKAINE